MFVVEESEGSIHEKLKEPVVSFPLRFHINNGETDPQADQVEVRISWLFNGFVADGRVLVAAMIGVPEDEQILPPLVEFLFSESKLDTVDNDDKAVRNVGKLIGSYNNGDRVTLEHRFRYLGEWYTTTHQFHFIKTMTLNGKEYFVYASNKNIHEQPQKAT